MTLSSFLLESIVHKISGQEGSASTQVATTAGTYRKSGQQLKNEIPHDGRVLNYGAGLDHTTHAIKEGLGEGKHTVHDYEPFPEKRKAPPTFTKSEEVPKDHYHAVVCHNVLNVVEPHIREHITRHILSSLKEGGVAHIGTRKWKGDIDKTKNSTPAEEEHAVWVNKGKHGKVYQKGFDGDELKKHVEDIANRYGHQVEVKKSNLAASGVTVKLKKKNPEE